ncbi:hypothetical protein Tco_0360857 [Tanacetum coccineum]
MLHDAESNVHEKNVKKLQLFVDAEKPLYNGCKKFTKLSLVVKLLDLKAKNNWRDKSFTTLLEHEALHDRYELPVLTKRTIKELHECPVCMESRYKHKNLTELDCDVTKNAPPAKLLWYLPIIYLRLISYTQIPKVANLLHGMLKLSMPETGNKENKDTVPKKERITDGIYNWITAKYGAPNETWNGDQIDLVADDVVKTFFDKSDSEQDVLECLTKAETVSKCSTKEATVPECSMIEANVPECSTKKATKDVASHIAATNILSAELVTVFPISNEEYFLDEVEDDTDEEAEDEKDDSDDGTWSPKTIGTTSKNIISPNKKGATSSSSPSTKKKLVNRGKPVRHYNIRLANPITRDMIVKKEFGVRKEEVKKVNESKEQVNKGEGKGLAPEEFTARNDLVQALHDGASIVT